MLSTPSIPAWRRRALVLTAVLALTVVAAGCDALTGDPTPTHTPAPSATVTSTPTITPSPTPTATPPPVLPPNPDALRRWADHPVTYCIGPTDEGFATPDEFVGLIDAAFAAWGVPANNTGACGTPAEDDGVNGVGWGSLGNGDSSDGGVFEAGLTRVSYSQCTSGCDPDDLVHIVEADITVDTAPPQSLRTRDCLNSTLLHEVGHFLGLEHLPPPAVMAAETTTCLTALTDADIEAIRARYGAVAQPAP